MTNRHDGAWFRVDRRSDAVGMNGKRNERAGAPLLVAWRAAEREAATARNVHERAERSIAAIAEAEAAADEAASASHLASQAAAQANAAAMTARAAAMVALTAARRASRAAGSDERRTALAVAEAEAGERRAKVAYRDARLSALSSRALAGSPSTGSDREAPAAR
jgi:hypothetical protein